MEGGIHYPYPHSPQALPQGLPVSYKGWANHCLLDRSACLHQFKVGEKTHSTVDAEMRPVLIRGHGQGPRISHPENFSSPSTLLGFEGLRAAPDEDKMLTHTNPTHYSQQKSASNMGPSDQSQSTPVGAMPNISITSPIPSSSFMQRALRNRSHQPQRARKEPAEESSWSSRQLRQPADMHETLERPYVCHTCGKRYAQPGSVMRHYRAQHNPNSCTYCGAEWSRPYQYRNHLETYHHDVDPDLELGKPASSRRRLKVIGRGRPQIFLPRVVEHDQYSSQAANRRPSLMPPLPAMVKVPQVPLAFPYAEELAQPVDDVVDHFSSLPRALPSGFTTANCSSRPVTANIPFPCPPVGGYYGDPDSADPLFEPSVFIHPYDWL